jgi:N-acetylglucosaminyldiphosphoundecaprenol N-acetyl-beta-D-mannosaminyltransferase
MKNTTKNNIKKSQPYATILGIKVNSTPKRELLVQIQGKLAKKEKFYIVTPNPEIILQAQNNLKLASALNNADFSIPDGFGLKLANTNLEIIKGRELMLDLFKIANKKKLKVYLLGSTKEVNEKSLNLLGVEYPNIIAKGSAPYTEVDTKEINSFKPDLLFIAFGAPKQETWINNNLKNLNLIGAMAIGGSLDYYSGFVKPVPNLLASLKLEWLWRLIQEPKRIGRIIKATIIFPLKVMLSDR